MTEAEQRAALVVVEQVGPKKARALVSGHRLIEAIEQRKREGRVRILLSQSASRSS